MNTNSYKTTTTTPDDINKGWVLFDAEEVILGRLASEAAGILRGKHKPEFAPHLDTGDNVIVINAGKIKLSGKKMQDKKYFTHSGYPGSERFTTAEEKMEKDPTFLVRNAIKGMLPKNKLGRKLLSNLRIYVGSEHPHQSQNPQKVEL